MASGIPSLTSETAGAPVLGRNSTFNLRRGLGAFLSAVVPGIGHLLVKRWKRGFALLGISIVVLALHGSLRPALHIWAFGLIVSGTFALGVFSACDVAYSSPRSDRQLSPWWLVFLLPAAVVGTSAQANLGLLLAGTRPYKMAAGSMRPLILPGDKLMVDLRYYRLRTPKGGDVIVFSQPSVPGLYLVKRVIAVGGQTVDIEDDRVSVDEVPLAEPYMLLDQKYPDPMPHFHEKVPPGKLFVLGDDRHISFDSRFPNFGLVDMSAVRGKVIYVLPKVGQRVKSVDGSRGSPG